MSPAPAGVTLPAVYTGPERPAEGNERWIVAAFTLVLVGLFSAEIARNFDPVKLSVPFMVLLLLPMTALHELGHALVSALFGWRICRIVIGVGRPLLRVRYKDVPIDVRMWPVGGHVLPAPRALRRPRLESTLIYAAGPGAELAVALGVLAVIGPERAFTLTDSIPIIAAQSVMLLVAVHLVTNLVPLPTMLDGQVGYTDGLGLLLSPFLPDWHYRQSMTLPWAVQAERCAAASERVQIYQRGIAALPDNAFMRLHYADALFEAGEVLEARQQRLQALQSEQLPEQQAAKLRRQLGLS